jgi:spermidine synthase
MTRNAEAPLSRAARALPYLVALSGAAALVYESLWMRAFGLIFGNTTSAVAWVLAVFLGGLAIGSALAARRPSRHPLRDYARVELAVGVAALVTLPLLRALPWAYGALVARAGVSGALEAAGRVLLAALVLLPATILLGATVPLALAFLERAGRDVRAGFGRLYLLNTLGGACGIALAGFVLLEAVGVRGTLVSAAAASLFVGGVALRWARDLGPAPAGAPAGVRPAAPAPRAPQDAGAAPGLGLALAAVSGAATFGVELLWTRSLVLVIGSTSYAFHTMLLAVLLGIALGTAAYGRWRGRIARPLRAVGVVFACAGLGVVAGQWWIGLLPSLWLGLIGALPVSFAAQQLASLLLCLVVLLPVTGLLGLSFPMLLHLAEVQDGTAQRAAGRLYAWNTLAAVAAALATDLWLLPALGLQPPYLVFAGLLLAGGLYSLLESAGVPRLPKWTLVAALAVALGFIVPRWKPWDPVLMSAGVHRYGLDWSGRLVPASGLSGWLRQQRTLLFYREGTEAVVAVSEAKGGSGRRFLSLNGKTDAGSSSEDVVTQKFIAHVPMLIHPGPRQALVIGWGAGATAASLALHPVASVECVEIEKATWEAAPLFADLSGALARDPRFQIRFADGRNHLLRSRGHYDLIVSEPSNPWISGVSNLFTREFYVAARAALARGGVFGQWFHYYNLHPSDVKVELATFLSVFPNASLWLVPPTEGTDGSRNLGADLLLVGSLEPQTLDWLRLERAFGDERIAADLRATRVLLDPIGLAASWAMGAGEIRRWAEDKEAFPSGTPLNTDDYPYVELVAPRRNVIEPAAAARAAAAQYQALSRAAGDLTRFVSDQPLLKQDGPISAVFFDRLGERYAKAAQTERAIAAFATAAQRDPGDPLARARWGELLLEQGRPKEAEPELAEAVRLDPTRARAWEGLGAIALDRHDYARAEQAHRALLRLEPANVSAWLRLGAALARQDKWVEAKDALDTARSIDPKAPIDSQLRAYVDTAARGLPPKKR